MAGKFGADFNASQPSDADLVKKGAQWIRDIKSRIKLTFGVVHNNETGQLLDNVVGTAALKDLNPDPSGTWNELDVNEKGQVTAGRTIVPSIGAKMYRWVYGYGGGFDPSGNAVVAAAGTDADGNTVSTYSFTFPADVTRIFVRVQAAGGGSAAGDGGGGGGAYIEATIDGAEGDVWLVWVGTSVETGLGTPPRSAASRFYFSAFKYLLANGGYSANPVAGTQAAGGDTDVAGLTALELGGGAALTILGGAAGCGAPSNYNLTGSGGPGAMPELGAGADGFVTVDYWKN